MVAYQSGLQLCQNVILQLLSFWIGFLNQSEVKPKTFTTWLHMFFHAWHLAHVFALRCFLDFDALSKTYTLKTTL